MALVLDPSRRVEAHRSRREELPHVGGQVARRAIVTGHHERGPIRLGVEQGGQQVRPEAGRHERPLRRVARGLGEGVHLRGVMGVCQELAQRHCIRRGRPAVAARLVVRF